MSIIVTDQGIEQQRHVWVYVPENFDALALLGDLKRADAANWLLDRIYLYSRFAMRENEFGFTPLKVAYLRKVIPQTWEKELRERLIETGVSRTRTRPRCRGQAVAPSQPVSTDSAMPQQEEGGVHRTGKQDWDSTAVPPALPEWITPDFIQETIRVWQPYSKSRLTQNDAIEIMLNMRHLLRVLLKLD